MEDAFHCDSDGLVMGVDWFWVVRPAGWVARLSGGLQPYRPVPHSNTNRDGTRRKFATDSPLEESGFELSVPSSRPRARAERRETEGFFG
jgi:hypothetical protein